MALPARQLSFWVTQPAGATESIAPSAIEAPRENAGISLTPVSLEAALHPAAVRRVWRQLRPELLKLRPKDTRLVHDPLDYLAFQLQVQEYVDSLRHRVTSGRYIPRPAAVVRSVKRNRLTRPLVFPSIDDVVVLTALCAATREALRANSPPWVDLGGRTTRSGRRSGYDDWFRQFMRVRAFSDRIVDNDDELVVTTDIANFFPSINIALLRDRTLAVTPLDERAITLLFRILRECGSGGLYDPVPLHGLPQEPDDNARLLASFFLRDVDRQFHKLGLQDRYSRFVDDMLFSAENQLEASQLIARLQKTLESQGLAMNSGKTRIVAKDEFRLHHFPEENVFLDQCDGPLFRSFIEPVFNARARAFARRRPIGSWSQVMKRYYGAARGFESQVLVRQAWRHLRLYPELASEILDYLQVVSPTEATARRLIEVIRTDGSIYGDLEILSYEMLLHAPFRDRRRVRRLVVEGAIDHLNGTAGFTRASGYTTSLCILAIYKFGDHDDRLALAELRSREDLSVEAARQLYVVLKSFPEHATAADVLPHRFDDPDFWRIMSLYHLMETQPRRVLTEGRRWFVPRRTTQPERLIFRTRMLPILQSLVSIPESRPDAVALMRQVIADLEAQPNHQYVDQIVVSHLAGLCGLGALPTEY